MKARISCLWFLLKLSLLITICIVVVAAIGSWVGAYQDLLVNLLAAFMFVFIGTVVALIYYKMQMEELLRFFGLDASRSTITIYVSQVLCESGHAIGVDDQPTTCGTPAAPFRELEAANRFRELFAYPFHSLFNSLPIGKPQISDIEIQIQPSLLGVQKTFVPLFPFISVGGPAFNAASRFIEKDPKAQLQSLITGGETKIKPRDMPDVKDPYCGFVERRVRSQGHVFYAVGCSSMGSAGAAYYLATQWKKLSKEYDDDTDFLVRLRFDPEDFKRCLEVLFLKREIAD